MTKSYFALTIAPAKDPTKCTKDKLENVLKRIDARARYLAVHSAVFEISTHGYLHMHALVTMDKHQYMLNVSKYRGYSIRWDRLNTENDKMKWDSYIHKYIKNKYEQEQLLVLHWSLHNNMFL